MCRGRRYVGNLYASPSMLYEPEIALKKKNERKRWWGKKEGRKEKERKKKGEKEGNEKSLWDFLNKSAYNFSLSHVFVFCFLIRICLQEFPLWLSG